MTIRRVASELRARLTAWGVGGKRGSYRRFMSGESGAIAIYFGLSAIVFVGVAGLAVDAARGYLVKARLSEAIDAAALAGGKALQTSNNKAETDALAFFNANFPNGAMGATVTAPVINIGANNTTVTVSANAVIPTTLMRVLGFQNMTMVAAATVARQQGGLDVVFSFDISRSMLGSKISALKSNAADLIDSLYKPFTSGGQSQTITINGTPYSLLNVGVVPWNAKVNVRTYPKTTNGTITGPFGGSFANPMLRRYFNGTITTATLPGTYKAANSEVPLLLKPNDNNYVRGGWSGCVYARYNDDGDNTNDADTTLGTNSTWRGWEPIANDEGQGAGCYASDWNSGSFFTFPQRPNPGWPLLPSGLRQTGDCTDCPTVGILPLQPDAGTVKTMINSLQADGNTDAPQGLFWAWEVLMPGDPFNQAIVNPPFQRSQAIVFMTDGQNYGGNGDAYHGWFGPAEGAGTLSSKGKITLPDGTSVDSNLDNRLLQLAQKIKGTDPMDIAAVKIYVIQYQENNANLTTLLKKVASQPQAPYYFYAPGPADLQDIFRQIADSLQALRIVK